MSKSILIVDDDQSIRVMVGSILGRQGFEVDLAKNGNEAIALLSARHYDAVVLDVMMQEGSGHDVLATLSAQRPEVKCVVVISATSPANLERVASANVQAKLRKPFDIRDLLEAIDNCVATSGDAA